MKTNPTPTNPPTETMDKIIDEVNKVHSEEVKKVEATCPCPDCRKKRTPTEIVSDCCGAKITCYPYGDSKNPVCECSMCGNQCDNPNPPTETVSEKLLGEDISKDGTARVYGYIKDGVVTITRTEYHSPPTEPTVEKWEEEAERFTRAIKTLMKDRKTAYHFMTGWFADLHNATLSLSVQEAKAEMVEKIEKIMDKDRAKEIGDNIEIAFGERSCKVCGYNPEYQREYILASLKQEEEKV